MGSGLAWAVPLVESPYLSAYATGRGAPVQASSSMPSNQRQGSLAGDDSLGFATTMLS